MVLPSRARDVIRVLKPSAALASRPLSGSSKKMAFGLGRSAAVMTTLHNPKAIFFDEPLNGLDANAALGFKTLITSLAREGKTIVYCSHLLDVVERVCERIVIIHQGRLIADGSLPQLQEATGEVSLERIFNRLTATENLLARAEEFARVLAR